MKKLIFTLLAVLLLGSVAGAQSEPASGPLETGWKIEVSGGYSNLQNQETNNGFLTSAALRVAKHWNARFDYFATNSPKAAVIVVGPEYNFSLAHVLPASSFLDVAKIEAFVGARVGAGRSDPQGSPFKLAVVAGGGFNYRVSENVIVRPLEVNYVRSAATGSQVIGNHLQFAASIGYRF